MARKIRLGLHPGLYPIQWRAKPPSQANSAQGTYTWTAFTVYVNCFGGGEEAGGGLSSNAGYTVKGVEGKGTICLLHVL
jgi:hypothetical protein